MRPISGGGNDSASSSVWLVPRCDAEAAAAVQAAAPVPAACFPSGQSSQAARCGSAWNRPARQLSHASWASAGATVPAAQDNAAAGKASRATGEGGAEASGAGSSGAPLDQLLLRGLDRLGARALHPRLAQLLLLPLVLGDQLRPMPILLLRRRNLLAKRGASRLHLLQLRLPGLQLRFQVLHPSVRH